MKRKIFLVVLIVLAAVLLFTSSQEYTSSNRVNLRIGQIVFSIEVADEESERTGGLSGRESLDKEAGMLFVFEKPGNYTFWMKGMKFPLDIVWIKGNQVIGVSENLPPDNTETPRIYAPPGLIDKAVEINAGEVEKKGIKVGDRVEIVYNK